MPYAINSQSNNGELLQNVIQYHLQICKGGPAGGMPKAAS